MRRLFVIICAFSGALSDDDALAERNLFPKLPVGVPKSENVLCKEHSDLYRASLANSSLWAHEMWDATARSASGVLRANIFQTGHFEQCLTARAPFPTQYCLATIIANVPEPMPKRKDIKSLYFDPNKSVLYRLHDYKDKTQNTRNVINVAWCVPASCTKSNLETSLNEYLDVQNGTFALENNVTYDAMFNEKMCHTMDDYTYFDGLDVAFCLVSLVLVATVVLATIYDYGFINDGNEKPLKQTKVQRIALGFSARKNFLEMSRVENNDKLSVLYGIRTFSIIMIMMDHRFGTYVSGMISNFDYVEHVYRAVYGCFIFHGDLFVDTFFVMSGLLVTYVLLKKLDKTWLNPAHVILLRYIRLTPAFAFVIFYYASIFNHTGWGPMWKLMVGQDSADCRKNWWVNILYLGNYIDEEHICMAHSWYLPCDFHYFIIAVGVCILISKRRKAGLISLGLLTLISLIIPFMIVLVYKRPSSLQFYPDFLRSPKDHPDYLMTYTKSHTRATPYFVGMMLGYIYYKLRDQQKHIRMVRSYLYIAISILLLLLTLLTGNVFYDPYHPYNAVEAATYAALHRLGWALGTSGIIYVSSYGHADFFKKVLSWSPWLPLSKLVYCAYLVHMQFDLRAAANLMDPGRASISGIMILSMAELLLAFIAALGLYLTVEAPFNNLFKELLIPARTTPAKKEMTEPSEPVNSRL